MSARRAADRERFLVLLDGLRELRAVEASGRRSALTDFHARHKYTLLAFDEAGMRELGGIAASAADRPRAETLRLYRERFSRALARPAAPSGHVNALLHAFGHLSDRLTPAQRAQFLQHLADVRTGAETPGRARALLRSWADPAREPWLAAQTYLAAPETATNGRPHGRIRQRRHLRYSRCVPAPAQARGPRRCPAD